MPMLDQITIVGMGMVGGSAGIAARKRKVAGNVIGFVRDKRRKGPALKADAADKISLDYARALKGSQMVILAVPVTAMEACAKEILPHIGPDTIITDVGSVKESVVASLEKIFAGKGHFVGAHPMAGSEKAGIDGARGDLFEKAMCILTPTPQTDQDALDTVGKFWRALGAKTCICSTQDHDRIMANVSHLPHLLAFCLMHSTIKAAEGYEDPLKYIGPCFRDMTRVAASSPQLWADIMLANRSAILRAATIYVEQLESFKELILHRDRANLVAFFSKAQEMRQKIS